MKTTKALKIKVVTTRPAPKRITQPASHWRDYKGNSAYLKALKLARIEQHIADGVVYLSLSLGVVAMFTFLNWAIIARYGV